MRLLASIGILAIFIVGYCLIIYYEKQHHVDARMAYVAIGWLTGTLTNFVNKWFEKFNELKEKSIRNNK